ncbi:SPRY-domain-containing protein [Gigaspora margarita]|uniref:SPRY-domain-containing protein n=1 Tax=Gigaspora margarita TaxID=4874 RepID=A0A8H4AUX0_GIGMA|nr:SPRY-domain-containing protein [Gigaspora margarita]
MDTVLPTAWDVEGNASILNVDSDGLKVSYSGPEDYEVAPIIRANHPIPPQCEIFYFEVKILDNGKYGATEVGFGTNKMTKDCADIIPTLGQEPNSWGYHGDNGYLFCSGSGRPYGPPYSDSDTIGCYLNFRNRIVFYTKNGVNLGIACHLPEDLNSSLYPCVGLSQGGSVEINFGQKKFEYLTMNNDDVRLEKNWLNVKALDIYYGELTKLLKDQPNNPLALLCRGKVCLIMGKYEDAHTDLTRLLLIEPTNEAALRYRGEVNFILKRCDEALIDLKNLVNQRSYDKWAADT